MCPCYSTSFVVFIGGDQSHLDRGLSIPISCLSDMLTTPKRQSAPQGPHHDNLAAVAEVAWPANTPPLAVTSFVSQTHPRYYGAPDEPARRGPQAPRPRRGPRKFHPLLGHGLLLPRLPARALGRGTQEAENTFHTPCVVELRLCGIIQACPMCREELPPGQEQLPGKTPWLYIPAASRVELGEASRGSLMAAQQQTMDEVMQKSKLTTEQGHAKA